MNKFLTRVLVSEFYKKYTKLFFISFCLFASYFLFIQIAGVFLSHNRDFWTLFLPLKFATDPLFILFFWIIAFCYAILAFRFVNNEIKSKKLEFLKCTFFTIEKSKRLKSWLLLFSLIYLPILLFSLYSTIVGLVILKSLNGFWTLLFCLILLLFLVFLTDSRRFSSKESFGKLGILIQNLNPKNNKWLLNLIHMYKSMAPIWIGSKILGIITIIIVANYFNTDGDNIAFKAIVFCSLSIALFSSILIYQDSVFEGTKMKFYLNFPMSKYQRFLKPFPFFLIMMIPEEVVSIIYFDGINFLVFLFSLLIFMLFIKTMVLSIGNRPMLILKVLFTFFFMAIILMLYDLSIVLLILTVIISYYLFSNNYQYEMIKPKSEL